MNNKKNSPSIKDELKEDISCVLTAIIVLTIRDGVVGFLGSMLGGAIVVFGSFMYRKIKSAKNKSYSDN